jgi:hypothetical protein
MSIVRDNLMSRPGYSPYCGNDVSCAYGMPRTHYKRYQFECMCGWRSNFEPEFIEKYEAKWAPVSRPHRGEGSIT